MLSGHIRFTSTTQERIKDSEQRNSVLDSVPFNLKPTSSYESNSWYDMYRCGRNRNKEVVDEPFMRMTSK